MRLWSLHPKYLDARGLVALWREGLLAQAVLAGQTRGYTHHPQLIRFRAARSPDETIAAYLHAVYVESTRRGYHFDPAKIAGRGEAEKLAVSAGQLDYEWAHLKTKLSTRAPGWLITLPTGTLPDPHPLFYVVPGGVAEWEVSDTRRPEG